MSGNAESSCVGARDRKGHGPTMLKPACTWSDTTTGVWCGCSVTLDVDIVAGVGYYVQLRPVNACGLSRVFLLLLCRAAAGRAGLAAAGAGL